MAENPVPPAFRSQLPNSLWPREFQTILSRLQQKYGSALRVTSADREWLEFHVEGMPLPQLYAELQQQRDALLFGFAERIQLIHPLRPGQSGLYFHLLSIPSFIDRARLAAYSE